MLITYNYEIQESHMNVRSLFKSVYVRLLRHRVQLLILKLLRKVLKNVENCQFHIRLKRKIRKKTICL